MEKNKKTNFQQQLFYETKLVFQHVPSAGPSSAPSGSPTLDINEKKRQLDDRANKILSEISRCSKSIDYAKLFYNIGSIDQDAFSKVELIQNSVDSQFFDYYLPEQKQSKTLPLSIYKDLPNAAELLKSWCNEVKESHAEASALERIKTKWEKYLKLLKEDLQKSIVQSNKMLAYCSVPAHAAIRGRMHDEITKLFPGWNGGYNPTGIKVNFNIAMAIQGELSDALFVYFNPESEDIKKILLQAPNLSNGRLNTEAVFKWEPMQYIFQLIILKYTFYLEQFSVKQKPEAKQKVLVPGSDKSKAAEDENTGSNKEINEASTTPSDEYKPGMDKEQDPEKLKQNNFLFLINPPLLQQEYFKNGVYNGFTSKGVATLDKSPFNQSGITQNSSNLQEHTMTGIAQSGGSYIIPLPNEYAISSIESPAGAVITKNQNNVYKLTYTGEKAEIRIKIFKNDEDLINKPSEKDKEEFLGQSSAFPNFGRVDIDAAQPAEIISLAQKFQNYINTNTFYDTDSALARRASDYYRSQPNYFIALEERKFAYEQGEKFMVADCDVANMYFVGLCRAAGIPARMSVGYMASHKVGFSPKHAWSEIWDGKKWVRLDATPTRPVPNSCRNALEKEEENGTGNNQPDKKSLPEEKERIDKDDQIDYEKILTSQDQDFLRKTIEKARSDNYPNHKKNWEKIVETMLENPNLDAATLHTVGNICAAHELFLFDKVLNYKGTEALFTYLYRQFEYPALMHWLKYIRDKGLHSKSRLLELCKNYLTLVEKGQKDMDKTRLEFMIKVLERQTVDLNEYR